MPGLTNKRKGINKSVVTNYDEFTRQVAPPHVVSTEPKTEKNRNYDHSKEDFEIGKKEVEMALSVYWKNMKILLMIFLLNIGEQQVII